MVPNTEILFQIRTNCSYELPGRSLPRECPGGGRHEPHHPRHHHQPLRRHLHQEHPGLC